MEYFGHPICTSNDCQLSGDPALARGAVWVGRRGAAVCRIRVAVCVGGLLPAAEEYIIGDEDEMSLEDT